MYKILSMVAISLIGAGVSSRAIAQSLSVAEEEGIAYVNKVLPTRNQYSVLSTQDKLGMMTTACTILQKVGARRLLEIAKELEVEKSLRDDTPINKDRLILWRVAMVGGTISYCPEYKVEAMQAGLKDIEAQVNRYRLP
ncbi:hypothetical protein H6F89_18355 [Cyanobacteria bacterium FACHB-63]|nr:hypothetical protein [Cyanobacteria bacterium FACHB-63]